MMLPSQEQCSRRKSRRRNVVAMAHRKMLRCMCLLSVTVVSSHVSVSNKNAHFHGINTPTEDFKKIDWRSNQLQSINRPQEDRESRRVVDEDVATRDLIVGGSIVTSQAYRSFAVTDPVASNGLCGATLIHSDILISAAHCGEADIFADGTLLNIGSLSIYGDDAIDRIEVINQLIHPNYNADTLENDVMLIQLAAPSSAPAAQWNTDPSVPADGEELTVVGFGRTERGTASAVLREGTVNVIDTETCDAAYQLSINGERTLCAGSDTSTACSGDSGGPLFRNGLLVGVVSFGIVNSADDSCLTSRDLPNGYTRVSAISSFVSEGICSLSANPPISCLLQRIPPAPPPTKIPTRRPTPVPTKIPTRRPVTQAPATVSPTQTRVTALPPAMAAPRTPPPFFLYLLSTSPTINNVSMPPTVRSSLRPSYKPSASPSLDSSSSPTMDRTFVPSDAPTFVQYSSSTIPTDSPLSSTEATDSKEDINITTITLPRPKSDSTNTSTSEGANQNTASFGAPLHIGYNICTAMFAVFYGICIVTL